MIPQRAHVHIARLGDLDDIASRPLGTEWPPPGTHVEGADLAGTLEPPYPLFGEGADTGLTNIDVVSDAGPLPEEGFFWTTLANLFIDWPLLVEKYSVRLAEIALGLSLGPATSLGTIPVVWRAGEGVHMRWIRNTYRGSLSGGVEEFQFKIDLGNPGADPDLDDDELLALSEQLAAVFVLSAGDLRSAVSTEHKWVEVGCVMMEATTPTNAQGEGGNMAQVGATQWWAWTLINQPLGSSGGITLPLEVACAVTLQTDHRGPSGRGRFYLPPCGVQGIGAGGVFTAAKDFALTGTVAWLEGIKNATPYVPVVVSPRRLILNEVTSVNVGTIPDSQRRRRRSQVETRVPTLLSV